MQHDPAQRISEAVRPTVTECFPPSTTIPSPRQAILTRSAAVSLTKGNVS